MTDYKIHTTKKHYLKGILWSSCGNLVAMSASMLTTVLAARILSKESLGAFFLVLLVSQLAASLGDLGLRNTSIKFMSSVDDAEIGNVSKYVLTITIIFSTVTAVIVALISPVLSNRWMSTEFREVVLTCAPMTFVIINYQMSSSVLIGFKQFKCLSAIVSFVEILRMCISVSALYFGFGVKGLIYSSIICQLVGLILNWHKMPIKYSICITYSKRKEILHFGGWLYATSVMSIINVRVAEAILTNNLGTAALAVYGTAMQLPNIIQKMFESIRPVILSYISSLKSDVISSTVSAIRLSSGLLTIAASFLILFANPMIIFFFSRKYEQSFPVMQLASVWIVISIVNYYLSITLIGMGKVKKVLVLTLPQFVTMLLSSLILIPKYQSSGAVIALIITAIVGNTIASWMVANGNIRLFVELSFTSFRSYVLLFLLLSLLQVFKTTLAVNIVLMLCLTGTLFLIKSVTITDVRMLRSLIIRPE